ncbi:DUF6361 family protein [Polyangium spumosum]|uniref:Uncharacterized protein n=1 Tax=Polyangium spumosum TaxID=889282 RepID=A0A6N7PW09_9BACT|nr:DUF6361 family protein [Polyangium spumosum]MRG95717.1 hypothetical protein [Polyangium spumosum]
MARKTLRAEAVPFGWVEISDAALQRLRRELEQKGQGVVDEMGVLAIHTGYADHFFPGTSVLQTRARYLFFVCWNFLWLARQRGITAANLAKRKDEADLWVTRNLVATQKPAASPGGTGPDMQGIIGVNVFYEKPPRLPAQRVDFVYWTALRRWGFYRSRTAYDRAQLFRRWRGAAIGRVGEAVDEGQDDTIRAERLAEFMVPTAPTDWQKEECSGLTFELTGPEARWLQERLLSLDEVAEGPRLLAKAAELCAQTPPRMDPDARPWDDPLAVEAARAARQSDRLERARQASALAYYVRAIYGALVEWVVEVTARTHRDVPLRHYRDRLADLAGNRSVRDASLAMSLPDLYTDVPRIPSRLRRALEHVQGGLRRIAQGEDAEAVFMNEDTHRLFEAVERDRKGARARLTRTDQGAARRVGFGPDTVGVYDLDYRWGRVRSLLWDLHRGLARP